MNFNSEKVQLRAALPDDEPFLRELFAAVHRPQFEVLALPEPFLQDLLAMQLRAQNASYDARFPNGTQQILLHDEQAIGRIWTNFAPNEIRLVDVSILPAQQNQGIGTALLRALMDAATSARPLRLSVALNNSRADSWYQRLGLHATGDDGVYRQMQWPIITPVAND